MYNVQFAIYYKRNIFEIIITILNDVHHESFSCLTR